MCGVQLKDIKRAMDFMLVWNLNDTMDQLAISSCLCRYSHVLRMS